MNDDSLEESERMITAKSTHSLPNLKAHIGGNQKKLTHVCSFRSDSDALFEETRVAAAFENEAVETCMQGIVQLSASTNFVIRDIFWYTFPTQKFGDRESFDDIRFLILVGDMNIECVTRDRRFPFQLPFKVTRVLPSPVGLIIERESHESEVQHIPHVFSLSHPYNEILPILCNHKDFLNDWSYAFSRPGYELIDIDGNFLMVYDNQTNLNMVYRVRKSDETEWQCARRTEIRRLEMSTPKQALHTPDRTNAGGSCAVTPVARSMLTRSMTSTALAKAILNKPTPQRSQMISNFTPSSLASQHSILSAIESPWTSRVRGTPMSMPQTPFSNCGGDEIDLRGTWESEMCLDFIWSETPKMNSEKAKASKIFLSTDLVSYTFLNYLIPTSKEMRSLRIIQENVVTTLSGPVIHTACHDASSVLEGLTVVLHNDGSLHLYTGATRLCLLVLPIIVPNRVISVDSAGSRSVLMQIDGSDALLVNVPHTFWAEDSSRIWCAVANSVNHDTALKMACKYRLANVNKIDDAHQERRSILQFIIDELGFVFHSHPLLSETFIPISCNSDDSEEGVVTKQKRPIRTPEQNMLLVDTNGKNTDPQWISNLSPVDCTFEVNLKAPNFANANDVFGALHALYEDCKLRRNGKAMKEDLVHILYAVSSVLNLKSFSDYYLCECADLIRYRFEKVGEVESPNSSLSRGHGRRSITTNPVFSVYDTASHLITSFCPQLLPPSATQFTAFWTVALAVGLCRVVNNMDIQRLLGKNWAKRLNLDRDAEKSVLDIVSDKKESTAKKCERILKLFSFTNWDVSRLPPGISLLFGDILLRQDTLSHFFHRLPLSSYFLSHPPSSEFRRLCSIRWPNDVRADNVEQMLSSNRPVYIPDLKSAIMTDAELREQQEQFVLAVAIRTMTQSFGRAMFQFRTEMPAPNDVIVTREMCFSGRTYPGNRPIELNIADVPDMTAQSLRVARDWGNFFNGVSTGLRVKGTDELELLGEWIQMSYLENLRTQSGTAAAGDKNQKPTATAAGVLLAFGLNGHLPTMNIFTAHEMLTQQDRFTSVALTLGYAVSKAGTGDEQVNRILVTHISFLMGPTMLEVNIEPIVQTSALVSMGILFAEKTYANLINSLLNEMGKAPQPEVEPSGDRYSYALATGFAIGLIGLGHGESLISPVPFSESRPDIIERLLVLMEGGPRDKCVFNTDPLPDLTRPFEDLGQSKLDSNHIKEIGGRVNVHLTSHPATISLGLLFMKTGNQKVEFILRLPQSISGLEEIRPDVIPVRVMCRALVMWEDIQSTNEWVDKQIPKLVLEITYDSIGIANGIDKSKPRCEKLYSDVDQATVVQVYIYTVAGACFAMALKFAGTHDEDAKNVIYHYLEKLLPLSDALPSNLMLRKLAEKGTVHVATNILISALAIVMAGSGDLDVLRICRLIRVAEPVLSWYKNNYSHSTQMTVHMAMGLLFLGHARYTLCHDNLAIASLIISFYPVSNHHIADNRLYLQPLRFLWVLAARRLLFSTVDIKTEQLIPLPVTIEMKDATIKELRSPCHLPSFSEISKLTVGGGEGGAYETLTFDLSNPERAQLLKITMEKHHGRLGVTKIKPEIDMQRTLTECGIGPSDFLPLSELDGVTNIWKTHLTTGTSDEYRSHWNLLSSTERDLEEFMLSKNAFPLKEALHELHNGVMNFDPMSTRDVCVTSALSHAREDSRAVGQHISDRLLDTLRTYADMSIVVADDHAAKGKCNMIASGLGPHYRRANQTFSIRED